jgi:uncharacterized spore protein YtfJ
MEKKKVIIGNPIAVGAVTLIPVAEVSLNHWCGNGSISFFGVKQPVRVIVVSPAAKRAFRITGEEVSLDQLLQEAPGIREVLERI